MAASLKVCPIPLHFAKTHQYSIEKGHILIILNFYFFKLLQKARSIPQDGNNRALQLLWTAPVRFLLLRHRSFYPNAVVLNPFL